VRSCSPSGSAVSRPTSSRKPWLLYHGVPSTRPWAWWNLEEHPPRAERETEAEYLTRHDLWLPGERQQFATAGMQIERPPEIASRNAQIELYWFLSNADEVNPTGY
jgi:hypothetical protein